MKRIAALAGFAVVAWATSALAHHSYAIFDESKVVKIEGKVKAFLWASPHSWVDLNVANSAGGTTTWPIECAGPSVFVRLGWTKTTIKPGDKLVIEINPLKTGKPGGSCKFITLPNGTREPIARA